MKKISVNLNDRSYDIEIGSGNLALTDFARFGASRFAVISDSNVAGLYGDRILQQLGGQGLEAELIKFPAGEESKSPETAVMIGRKLAKRGFDKHSIIIALGGGVTGDLAGFVASFYLRGIRCIQVPTTLLAQVDSSIGGKTGVDIPEGKNLFGTFYQPQAVIADVSTLRTLPEKEFGNGFAELIKYGMTLDAELFRYLEQNSERKDEDFYQSVVEASAKIKAGIVEQDEKEGELRKILNYGHTIGHAVELAEDFRIPHGEAVAIGMAYEAKIACKLGLLSEEDRARQGGLLDKFGLPTIHATDPERYISIMRRDKKNEQGQLYFVLPTAIGQVKTSERRVAHAVDESLVREILS